MPKKGTVINMKSASYNIKQQKKRQIKDRQRILRVVEYLEYNTVFEKCPVEINEGYIVSDVTDYSIFASFVFRNVSKKRIKSLDVRLLCYQKQNIPYLKLPFTYSFERYTLGTRRIGEERIRDKKQLNNPDISVGESFGETVYIPIPESYFSRLELEITGVRYTDGTYEELGIINGKPFTRFVELDDDKKFAYVTHNIFIAAEENYPSRFIPQKGEFVWLCCCAHKNLNEQNECERCHREQKWQFDNISINKLEEISEKIAADTSSIYHDKSKYSQTKYLETDEEIQRKTKAYELAMKRIAEEERRKERLKTWIIPKIILCLLAIYLIAFAMQLIYDAFISKAS
ncbi:MAG: hypothetical protein CVU97_04350 [Firmicutes bacterium HGW-Firmicutes-21]|nr:MAG: hypothetical protein CVU97_04350 [Firmicutes bacterium HGW-Firmicutes-21]